MKVTRLTILPVKGVRASHPERVEVTGTGIRGDRQFFLVDDRDKLISATRTGAWLGLTATYDPDAETLAIAGEKKKVELGEPVIADFYGHHKVAGREVVGQWAALFTGLAGRPVRLIRADEPNGGRDEHALTLLGDASTRELAERSGLDGVDARRFRMSIEFDGAGAHAEDTWNGRDLRIGAVTVRVGGAVPRCAATNRNPESGGNDLTTLRLITAYRGAANRSIPFGVYADVLTPGVITLGDELTLD
ncbi:MOSC domain-containing protein [Actinoplanes sp. NPDC051851]|uniref:MOSC domain-containing protein n=1 Tax=Actinoplanes sp. NPDC051851 TaxID=3154753 RepID=UPI00341C35A8